MEEHINVADEQELLNRLRLFLESQGWTTVRHEQNSAWVHQGGGVYAFDIGDEFFLEVNSNGYGNQVLHFRFRIWGALTSRRYLHASMGYGNTELNTASGNHPVAYFKDPVSLNWVSNPFSLSTGTYGINSFVSDELMPRVWFFGFEQKYCCAVIQLDAQRVHYIQFGTHELHDFNADYGGFIHGVDNSDWKTQAIESPFDTAYFFTFSEYVTKDGRNGTNANKQNTSLTSGSNGAHTEYMVSWAFNAQAVGFPVINDHSELRPFSRSYWYVKDPADGIWFFHGRPFWFRRSCVDLRIGERFEVSTEEYISFPTFQIDLSKIGVVFRIA
jgi:hypothetical protein